MAAESKRPSLDRVRPSLCAVIGRFSLRIWLQSLVYCDQTNLHLHGCRFTTYGAVACWIGWFLDLGWTTKSHFLCLSLIDFRGNWGDFLGKKLNFYFCHFCWYCNFRLQHFSKMLVFVSSSAAAHEVISLRWRKHPIQISWSSKQQLRMQGDSIIEGLLLGMVFVQSFLFILSLFSFLGRFSFFGSPLSHFFRICQKWTVDFHSITRL